MGNEDCDECYEREKINKEVYAVLDIEATGGKLGEESIIEIAIYKYDGKEVVDQFISLINPEKKIDSFVQKLTHITDKMVTRAPKFHEVARRIVDITSGCVLVGHNVMFDYRMLHQEFERLGYHYHKEWIDTFEFSEQLIPGLPSYSLGKLCDSLGIIVTDRHRASGDARATLELFKLLLTKDSAKIISRRTGTKPVKKVNAKYDSLVENLPNATGLFYLYNSKKALMYIGKSRNIALSVNELFTSKAVQASKLKGYTSSIRYEETGSYLLANIKEILEIRINKPHFNPSLEAEHALLPFGLFAVRRTTKYGRLEIGKKRKSEALLRFQTKESAEKWLDFILEKYTLCKTVNAFVTAQTQSCFAYKVNQCNGACLGKESKRLYNLRLDELENDLALPGNTFLVFDKGRSGIEQSFFFVKDGVIKGYGYFEYHHQIKTIEKIENILTPLEENSFILNLLKLYLLKTNKDQVKVFN